MQATTRRTAAKAASKAADATPEQRAVAARSLLVQTGWDEERVSEPFRVDDSLVIRVAPAEEPRLSIILSPGDNAVGSASLAYSSESELMINWGAERVTLGRPTHWELVPGDSPGLSGEASDRWALEDIFGLLAPERMLGGEPQQVTNLGRSHEALAENLGNALATLRSEVAEAELTAIDELDREVLRLFHQLLFIRVQEDRGKGSGDERIQDLLPQGDEQLLTSLDALVSGYREELNSDLFRPSRLSVEQLGVRPLRPLLQALVLPWQQLKLNFSLSRADLAGRLYQQYLKRTPAFERAGEGAAPRLVGVAVQRDEQQQTAAYYTPMSVASLLASETLGAWLETRSPSKPQEIRLVDPACGSGSFLVAGFKLIREALESNGRTLRPAQREEILRESIFGADIDAKAIEITQLQLLEAAELDRSRLPDLDQNLFVGDSLYPPATTDLPSGAIPWQAILERTGGFDAVLMNPPFTAQLRLSGRLDDEARQALRERFPDVAAWGSDLAYYFVSLAFALKKDDGCAGMIVPRKLLDGKGAAATRKLLREVSAPDRIVDFRGLSLFPGILPQVAMLEFLPGRRKIEALDIADSTVDSALALNTILEHRNGIVRRTKVLPGELGNIWTPFALRWQSDLSTELGCDWELLGETEEVSLNQGTQVGDQKAFTISKGAWLDVGDGQLEIAGHRIAEHYAPLVAWGAAIRPLAEPRKGERLFFPFEEDKSVSDNPEVKALLSDLGQFRKRPQPGAVAKLRARKVILRAFSREPAAFADLEGSWITVKGTKGGLVLVPALADAERLKGLAALLCSSLYQWLLRGFGQPRRDETIEIAQGNAEALPWPTLHASEWALLAEAANLVQSALRQDAGASRTLAYREARRSLDDLVLELLKVGPRLRETIASELVRYL